jgi:hypothetical protein
LYSVIRSFTVLRTHMWQATFDPEEPPACPVDVLAGLLLAVPEAEPLPLPVNACCCCCC